MAKVVIQNSRWIDLITKEQKRKFLNYVKKCARLAKEGKLPVTMGDMWGIK